MFYHVLTAHTGVYIIAKTGGQWWVISVCSWKKSCSASVCGCIW